jgi:hypothetical protein
LFSITLMLPPAAQIFGALAAQFCAVQACPSAGRAPAVSIAAAVTIAKIAETIRATRFLLTFIGLPSHQLRSLDLNFL